MLEEADWCRILVIVGGGCQKHLFLKKLNLWNLKTAIALGQSKGVGPEGTDNGRALSLWLWKYMVDNALPDRGRRVFSLVQISGDYWVGIKCDATNPQG